MSTYRIKKPQGEFILDETTQTEENEPEQSVQKKETQPKKRDKKEIQRPFAEKSRP